MRKIVVEDHNEEWAKEFDVLRAVYLEHLRQLIIDIQHVGSTSVPGLAAKPVLDIDIIIDNKEKLPSVINILDKLGYTHRGDLGIKEREAFKRASDKVPYHDGHDDLDEQDEHDDREFKFAHNLYVCIAGSVSLENHISFRDHLRDNDKAVMEYSELKKELASKHEDDIDRYIDGKTEFITKILSITGINENDIQDITKQNKC